LVENGAGFFLIVLLFFLIVLLFFLNDARLRRSGVLFLLSPVSLLLHLLSSFRNGVFECRSGVLLSRSGGSSLSPRVSSFLDGGSWLVPPGWDLLSAVRVFGNAGPVLWSSVSVRKADVPDLPAPRPEERGAVRVREDPGPAIAAARPPRERASLNSRPYTCPCPCPCPAVPQGGPDAKPGGPPPPPRPLKDPVTRGGLPCSSFACEMSDIHLTPGGPARYAARHPGGGVDFEAYRAMLAEQNWGDLSKRLTRYAFKHGKDHWERFTMADAEDVAQEAIRELFDPATPIRWDPASEPNLYYFLKRPVKRIINTRGVARARHALRASQVAAEFAMTAAEQEAARKRRRLGERRIELLRAELADDPNALTVLDCLEQGFDDIKETARLTHLAPNLVRNARLRIVKALGKVKRDLGEEEESPRG
jgi:DNA-directed RNA polymerase specialized sigma24 family protein